MGWKSHWKKKLHLPARISRLKRGFPMGIFVRVDQWRDYIPVYNTRYKTHWHCNALHLVSLNPTIRVYNRVCVFRDVIVRKYLCCNLSMYGSTVLLLDLGRFFNSLMLHTVDRSALDGKSACHKVVTYPQTQTKWTQTSMPWVGLEPTIPASERAKTVHALDCAATVTGYTAM
jgi:hypothetical protein